MQQTDDVAVRVVGNADEWKRKFQKEIKVKCVCHHDVNVYV